MKSSAPLSTASSPRSSTTTVRRPSVRPNVHPSLAHHGEHRRLVLGLHLWVRHRRPVPVARAVFLRSRVRVTLGRLLTRVARRAHRERHRGPDRDSHVARSQSVSRPVPPGGDLDVDVGGVRSVGAVGRTVGATMDVVVRFTRVGRNRRVVNRRGWSFYLDDDERTTRGRREGGGARCADVHHTIVSFLTLYV